MSAREFANIGMPAPRKTFLDSRGGSATSTRHTPRVPSTERQQLAAAAAGGGGGSNGTRGVILAEHKVELNDMLQESVSILKNVYRSKFVFGEHLKHVDPSYGGDKVNHFNLVTPPMFSPAYSQAAAMQQQQQQPVAGAEGAEGAGGAGAAAATAGNEKLRTAEELIKKLYRRNTQLEVENKYLQSEVQRYERFSGAAREVSTNLTLIDGHLPMSHPLYTKKTRRSCRSCPPQRTLMRAAVNGAGLVFPPRGGGGGGQGAGGGVDGSVMVGDGGDVAHSSTVSALKRQIVQFTEALVAIQHENDKLTGEKKDRVSLRDNLMKRYIIERDQQIALLHESLQEVLGKINNPLKLMRSRQPAANMNPVVATNNVLKEVSNKINKQISDITDDLVKKTAEAVPPTGADAVPHNASVLHGAPQQQQQQQHAAAVQGMAEIAVAARRKELTRRLRAVVDMLPVPKRKQLLLVMSELKELYEVLYQSNKSLLCTYEDLKARTSNEAVQLKLQLAMAKDQLRSLGVAGGGGGGGSPTKRGSGRTEDP